MEQHVCMCVAVVVCVCVCVCLFIATVLTYDSESVFNSTTRPKSTKARGPTPLDPCPVKYGG